MSATVQDAVDDLDRMIEEHRRFMAELTEQFNVTSKQMNATADAIAELRREIFK